MPLADLRLRLSEPVALFEARWSPDRASRREAAVREFLRDALVTAMPLIGQMRNHPKDRHVLAAAEHCEADFLFTFNLRDFPADAGAGLPAVVGRAEFLQGLWQMDPSVVEERIRAQAEAIGISPETLPDKLARSVAGFIEAARSQG